ncbi:cytochrome P450 [Isoptericola sp. 178]|uniref:cytochrome P450 n=1 Tax=Isoptericola sp. 178 TaxID=3064651 RepID=UPI00271281D1|nr:cytochrome P450 [Isoptericola sp. 178]MDO8145907.1 cytochrome P450 [Isoptericola sp. 178]
MTERARSLGPVETARTLLALTRGDRVEHLTRLAGAHPHGCVMTLPTGRVLVARDTATVKHVLVDRADRYVKGMGQLHAREMIGDGLLTAEGDTWREQRAAARPYLRARAVQHQLGHVVRAAHEAADRLHSTAWHRVDLTVHLASYTLTCLARTFGFAPPDGRRVHEAFDVVQDEAIFRAVTQGAVPIWLRPRRAAAVAGALAALRTEARTSLEGSARPDAWSGDDGMMSLFLAGYETTASTLGWAAGFLAHDGELQDRVAAEGERLADATTVTVDDLAALTWASAVFQDTLRLRPPVWLISRRAVAADTVAGVRLRAGDEVLLLPGATSADRSFEPGRVARGQGAPSGFAFGAGPRSCPGVSLAGMEGAVWLAVVARAVRLRPADAAPPRPLARMSQAPAGGAVVEVRSRATSEQYRPPARSHA